MNEPNPSPASSPVTLKQGLLIALAVFYLFLFIVWYNVYFFDRPILGLGDLEYFGRQAAPVAGRAPMTWRFAPGLRDMRVRHEIDPPAAATPLKRTSVASESAKATVYYVEWLSEGETVHGLLGLPKGAGPFPSLVVCHPSDDPYHTGFHTDDTVKFLAEMGVLAFSPDFRGWGKSGGQKGNEVRDALNALASLRALPEVRKDRLGLVGFSMGGGVAAKAAAADTDLALLLLYYPQMFGSVEELKGVLAGEMKRSSGNVAQLAAQARAAGADIREMEYALRMISPIYHLREFRGRVELFHGEKDGIVSVRQSEAVYGEMKRFQKPVELHLYPLDHAFANSIENPSKTDFEAAVRTALFD